MYGRRFWKRERLVKPAIETIRCWLGEEYGYSAEKDQEAGLAAQFGKGRQEINLKNKTEQTV